MEKLISTAQNSILDALVEEDQSVLLQKDDWEYARGSGGGRTCILTSGKVFEKGGVNISSISGVLPEVLANHLKTEIQPFQACGLSIVIHPRSPRVPTIHMNVRYFKLKNESAWFGGGVDLTPYVVEKNDFIFFHKELQGICNRYQKGSYEVYKKRCDQYFFLKHRNEMRGIGGIFFDYLKQDPEKEILFIEELSDSFATIYTSIVARRKNEEFSNIEKEFQLIRRGRYVEFNLLYDRGTMFGLQTDGRVESILMSLPEHVQFTYNYQVPQELEPMLSYYQPYDYVL